MKRVILTSTIMLLLAIANAQTNTFPTSGNVGIGTTTPSSYLELNNKNTANDNVAIKRSDNSPNLDIYSTYDGSDDIQSGSFGYGVRPSDNAWQIWERHIGNEWHNVLSVLVNGNVGIGTMTPSDKLSVNGKIRAQEIKVEAANWPDYVFKSAYKLMPLAQVESFIKQNGHLPEMPAAKEVAEKGIEVGTNQAVLLKKIEELTLYVIELKKENQILKKDVHELKRARAEKKIGAKRLP